MTNQNDDTKSVLLKTCIEFNLDNEKKAKVDFARIFYQRGMNSKYFFWMNGNKVVEFNGKNYQVKCHVEVEEIK